MHALCVRRDGLTPPEWLAQHRLLAYPLPVASTPSASDARRPCPLCGADDTAPRWQKENLRVVRCRHCAMLFASPVAPELASGAFYDRLAVPFYLSPAKLAGDFAPSRFARELKLFRQFRPNGAVLDVGCSTGAYLHELQRRFPGDYSATGTDVAGAALDHAASRGIETVRAQFLEWDSGARQFDAITFWAVLEHLVEPGKFLQRAAALLRPGGHCFALVPNLDSLAVRLLGAKYRYVMPDHLNYFSARTLRALAAKETTFEVVALRSTHFNPVVIAQDVRGGAARVPDEARARLLQRTTAWKENAWLKPVQAIYAGFEKCLGAFHLADNLVIVLRKKSARHSD